MYINKQATCNNTITQPHRTYTVTVLHISVSVYLVICLSDHITNRSSSLLRQYLLPFLYIVTQCVYSTQCIQFVYTACVQYIVCVHNVYYTRSTLIVANVTITELNINVISYITMQINMHNIITKETFKDTLILYNS